MYEDLKRHIIDVPDFPQKGIVFRDIAPLLAQRFPETIVAMASLFTEEEVLSIDGFAGVDSRGFVFAAALATHFNKHFIMPRKAGKLPTPFAEMEYALEYGTAKLQLRPGTGNVVVVDDVLATGGTLKAAGDLCEQAGYTVRAFAVLIDLQGLNDFIWNGLKARSVLQYF